MLCAAYDANPGADINIRLPAHLRDKGVIEAAIRMMERDRRFYKHSREILGDVDGRRLESSCGLGRVPDRPVSISVDFVDRRIEEELRRKGYA